MKIINQLIGIYKTGTNLIRLIYINIAVFIITGTTLLIAFLLTKDFSFMPYLAFPASVSELAMRPWSLITYMFFHFDVWHVLFNMAFLYWFGTILLQYLNQRVLLSLYLLGGVFGALLFMLSYNSFPVFLEQYPYADLLGASASAMAIMAAIATIAPNYSVRLFMIWSVKIKYIALVLIAIDVFAIQQSNPGGRISHLGGALFGLLFALLYKNGMNITKWMDPIYTLVNELSRPRSKMKVSYKRPKTDFEFNKEKTDNTKELDRILDKIKLGGYDSLSKEEKDFLFKQSN